MLSGPIIVIAATAALAASDAPAQADRDRAAITAGERRMCDLTNMSQTIDDTIPFYAKDVVQFDIMPDVFVGQAAVRESLAKQYKDLKNLRCQIQDLHVDVQGDLGYAFSVQAFEADAASDGPYGNPDLHTHDGAKGKPFTFRMAWRQTDIWRKRDGVWAMIHQHSSFPLDPKTGKPALEFTRIK